MHTNHPLYSRILDAAETIVIGDGVEALGFGTIAERLGVDRDEVQEAFPLHQQLLTALLVRMTSALALSVIDNIERDPLGGLPSRIYGYSLTAIFEAPLARSLYFRDPAGFTSIVRTVGGMGWIPQLSISVDLLPALQAAGMARQDVDADAITVLLNAVGAGAALMASEQQLDSISDALIMLFERSLDAPVTDTTAGKLIAQSFTGAVLTATTKAIADA